VKKRAAISVVPANEASWDDLQACFVVRTGFRRRGVSRALARAAVDFARERGARAIEGYPMITHGQEIPWGALYVGSRSIFADGGFAEVTRPTPRRVVMRIELPRRG
jgi:GNAT superfamily N-acetyltransferase